MQCIYVILLPKLNTSKSTRVTNSSKLYAVEFVCDKINDIELQVICTLVSSLARACSTYDQFLVRGNKQVDVTRVSTVSPSGSFPQILWSICTTISFAHATFFGGHMLSNMFHTNRKAVLDTLILAMARTIYLIWK
jgi:hypothetical protein